MNTQTLVARWAGEHRFDTGRLGGPTGRLDGSGETGQSPVDALLTALASCAGIDVVDILAKRRTPASSLEVRVDAVRRDTTPKRVLSARLTFAIDGAGIEVEQAERAIALSFEKYCSVAASIKQDVELTSQLVLNGTTREPVRHAIPT